MLVHRMLTAAGDVWPPFVLVAGLLLIGAVAAGDGLFEAVGARLARAPLRPRGLLVALLGLVAVVTAVLNLDTSVVFLTPVLIHAARRRGLDERPFLYGSVFMANAASLLLPGSNLTNLLVLRRESVGGASFGLQMLPAWLAACTITAAVLVAVYRLGEGRLAEDAAPPLVLGLGAASVAAAATLVLVLQDAAVPVLAVGLAATALRRIRPRLDLRVLTLLFVIASALGALAGAWDGPARLLAGSGRWETAAIGALGSVVVNNLPAAVVFSAQPPPHLRALLVGLDLGPDLAVTGSLSAFLWWQAARSVGARTSVATYSRLGLLLVPLTIVGCGHRAESRRGSLSWGRRCGLHAEPQIRKNRGARCSGCVSSFPWWCSPRLLRSRRQERGPCRASRRSGCSCSTSSRRASSTTSPQRGAVGLLVPGVGPSTNRRQALAEMLRGSEVNARLGGVPTGPRLITATAATGYPTGCCYIVVELPPKGRPAANDRRYRIAIVGRGYHGVITSPTTRIPGLASIVDIAPTALGRGRGALGSAADREPDRVAHEPQRTDPREQPAEVRRAARRRRLRALLPAASLARGGHRDSGGARHEPRARHLSGVERDRDHGRALARHVPGSSVARASLSRRPAAARVVRRRSAAASAGARATAGVGGDHARSARRRTRGSGESGTSSRRCCSHRSCSARRSRDGCSATRASRRSRCSGSSS